MRHLLLYGAAKAQNGEEDFMKKYIAGNKAAWEEALKYDDALMNDEGC